MATQQPGEDSDELEVLRFEVAAVGQLGEEERALLRSYGSQITALKRDLELVRKQTDFEVQRRDELSQQIQQEQRDKGVPQEHLEAIERREKDISEIRTEKAAMLEWLQRGVSEAQRISIQLETLKANGVTVRATESELNRDSQRLIQMEERLKTEIQEAKQKIERMKESKTTLEEHVDHQKSLMGVTEDILRSSNGNVDRLSSDVSRLQQRARDVETIEMSVGCLSASVRRAQHSLETVHNSVIRGMPPDEDDGYDSEDDAESTFVTPVVMASTKARLGRCDALLLTLWASLKTFSQDQQIRAEKELADYRATLSRAVRENEELREELGKDLQAQRKDTEARVQQLKGFIKLRDAVVEEQQAKNRSMLSGFAGSATGTAVEGAAPTATGEEAAAAAAPEEPQEPDEAQVSYNTFNFLRYIEMENHRLREENTQLRANCEGLQGKVALKEDDFNAVKELKKRYRDLEAQKAVLSHSIKECEATNRELKFFFHEGYSAPTAPVISKKKPPWRATPLEAGPL